VQAIFLVDVVRANEVRVVEHGSGTCFAVKALQGRLFRRLGCRQHFNGHAVMDRPVFAEEDLPHATGTDPFEHFVLADVKPTPLALQNLLGLEIREDAIAHQQPRNFGRFLGQAGNRFQFVDVALDARLFDDATLRDEFEIFFNGGRCCHAFLDRGGRTANSNATGRAVLPVLRDNHSVTIYATRIKHRLTEFLCREQKLFSGQEERMRVCLTNSHCWSPDSQWVYFDNRSQPDGAVFDGDAICRLHATTGEIETLYRSANGAHCGVVTVNPVDGRAIFILGPEDPTPDFSYHAARRQGMIVSVAQEVKLFDARDLVPPFTRGALRGGSHVHIFDEAGAWVSFTYEDHLLATAIDSSAEKNLRMVGVGMPGKVNVPKTHARNHHGDYFCCIVTNVVDAPTPGSDEIDRAYEEAWLPGQNPRRLVFVGNTLNAANQVHPELFLVELLADLRTATNDICGTATTRPRPPEKCVQTRITRTPHGLSRSPRFWPRANPMQANQVAVLIDDASVNPQLHLVSILTGKYEQITFGPAIASAFSWHPAGTHLAYVAGGQVHTVNVETKQTRMLTLPTDPPARPEACVFSPDGQRIAYVRQSDETPELCTVLQLQ
jgi:hypothetical protein